MYINHVLTYSTVKVGLPTSRPGQPTCGHLLCFIAILELLIDNYVLIKAQNGILASFYSFISDVSNFLLKIEIKHLYSIVKKYKKYNFLRFRH